MMIGLGDAQLPQPGDMCLDLGTGLPSPCNSGSPTLICYDENQGTHGPCGTMTGAGVNPLPILTLGDLLLRCPNNCQIAGAPTSPYAGCDPLIQAAGYDCSIMGGIMQYSRYLSPSGNTGYAVQSTPNGLGLSPAAVSYLVQSGIISQPANMNSPIVINPNASAPTGGPGAPASALVALQLADPAGAALPPAVNPLPVIPYVPSPGIPTSPNNLALGTPATTGGTIPGSNTAANGPAPMAPTGTGAATTSTTILPGVPNEYLYIGAAALLALLVLK